MNRNLTQRYIFGFNSTEIIECESILYANCSIDVIICCIQMTINNFN